MMQDKVAKREISLDTETTGFDPREHRVVEIGAVEMINRVPTGKVFHRYINPSRTMPDEAFRVHGLTEEFLSVMPSFEEVAWDFIAFIGDSRLIIHNAEFDIKHLSEEFRRAGIEITANDIRKRADDTLIMARAAGFGAASLDALCRRYGISNNRNGLHGALLDAQLLAEVSLELRGGRQIHLDISDPDAALRASLSQGAERPVYDRSPRIKLPTSDEAAKHAAFLAKFKAKTLWGGLEAMATADHPLETDPRP
jgi:DNA polymerase-3 subunit epsilon